MHFDLERRLDCKDYVGRKTIINKFFLNKKF